MRLRSLSALCLALGCPALSSGCGQAGVEGGADDEAEGSQTEPSTTSQDTSGKGALVGTAGGDKLRAGDGDGVVRGLGGTTRSTATSAGTGSTAGLATT